MKRNLLLLLFSFGVCFQSVAQSDDQAIALAKAVLKANGGQKNWDATRHIQWNFFGNRVLTWDKWTGDVRIEFTKEKTIYLVNINSNTGRALQAGNEITAPDSLAKLMKRAKEIWINDSYWLVMPYKLLDPGVTLRYIGEKKTEKGEPADVIELTFREVGVTPNNKYHIFVDKKTRRVSQWSFFGNFTDEKPRFTLPWQNYQQYGKIWLSGDRGERKLTDIKVFKTLPESTFNQF